MNRRESLREYKQRAKDEDKAIVNLLIDEMHNPSGEGYGRELYGLMDKEQVKYANEFFLWIAHGIRPEWATSMK